MESTPRGDNGHRRGRGRGRGGYKRPRGTKREPKPSEMKKRKNSKYDLTNTNLLIFPKKFEWLLFLKGLSSVTSIRVLDNDLYECKVVNNDQCYYFICLIMGLSDFDFFAKIKKMFTKLKNNKLFLLGSCGSLSGEGVYCIEKSYQSDRGFLRIDNSYVPRIKKIGTALYPNYDFGDLATASCFSSHFLNEADYMNCESFEGESVYDMETYYYYRFCIDKKISAFSCIRFVTDKVIKQSYQVVLNCLEICWTMNISYAQEVKDFFENGGSIDTEEFAAFYAFLRKVDRLTKVFSLDNHILDHFHNDDLTFKFFERCKEEYIEDFNDELCKLAEEAQFQSIKAWESVLGMESVCVSDGNSLMGSAMVTCLLDHGYAVHTSLQSDPPTEIQRLSEDQIHLLNFEEDSDKNMIGCTYAILYCSNKENNDELIIEDIEDCYEKGIEHVVVISSQNVNGRENWDESKTEAVFEFIEDCPDLTCTILRTGYPIGVSNGLMNHLNQLDLPEETEYPPNMICFTNVQDTALIAMKTFSEKKAKNTEIFVQSQEIPLSSFKAYITQQTSSNTPLDNPALNTLNEDIEILGITLTPTLNSLTATLKSSK